MTLKGGWRWRIYDYLVTARWSFAVYSRLHSTLRRLRVRSFTELVIEGFPRSGNTYAVVACEHANPDLGPMISHHTHSVANIFLAQRRDLPMVLLIRRPEHAVRSLCARYPGLTHEAALASYVRFHTKMLPFQGRFVVAEFRQVIDDFGVVIAQVNVQFGTKFNVYVKSPQSEREVARAIEVSGMIDAHGKTKEHEVARPSALRAALYDSLPEDVEYADLLDEATALYVRFTT